MHDKKVLLLTNAIPSYRKELYDRLGETFQLTIAHFGKENSSKGYNEINLEVSKRGPFFNLRNSPDHDQYDVVIVWGSLKFYELYKLAFRQNRKFKLIMIGPGVSSSYTKRYDSDWKVSFAYKLLLKKVDAAIFYDKYPVIKYSGMGINPNKLFSAPNTVVSDSNTITKRKDRSSFLFIGTLYKEKKVLILLKAYQLLKDQIGSDTPILNIIGDGPEKETLERWSRNNNLENIVRFHGRITNQQVLGKYFQDTLACISPDQAGLSVLESFAFGVPYVSSSYPISGGEFTAISDGVTGFTFDGTPTGLKDVILKIISNESLDDCFENCFEYYNRFRSPEIWLNRVKLAVNYVLK